MVSSTQFTTATLLALALNVAPALAFFRLICNAPLVVERADPIVSPGKISGHVHTIHGGSNFGLTTSYEELRASDCTSCMVQEDMSNYWTPSLYWQNEDGTFQDVPQVGGMTAYYLQRRDNDSAALTTFPAGFRMLAGSMNLREFNDVQDQLAINYVCLNYDDPKAATYGFPGYNCPQGLRAQIIFPSCWDGVNLDSDDHKSHMAYPSGLDNGVCPDSHPIRFITLFFETTYDINSLVNQRWNGSHHMVWAMGDPTGYGYHGDFINGWDLDTLENAINNCNASSGLLEDCPYFTLDNSDLFWEGKNCIRSPIVDEIVTGAALAALPGCNPIQDGPDNAVMYSTCDNVANTTLFNDTQVYNGSFIPDNVNHLANQPSTVVNPTNWTYMGCYGEYSNSRLLTHMMSTDDTMTVESCLALCQVSNYKYAGVEYATQCFCSDTEPPTTQVISAKSCYQTCVGDDLEYCGGPNALNVYKSDAWINPIVTSYKSWTNLGCYTEATKARALVNYISLATTNQTIAGCLDAAQAKGYTMAGMEYGGECWAGNALSAGSVNTSQSECNMLCHGNSLEYCGAGNRLSMYTLSRATSSSAVSSSVASTSVVPSKAASSSAVISSFAASSSAASSSSSVASSAAFSAAASSSSVASSSSIVSSTVVSSSVSSAAASSSVASSTFSSSVPSSASSSVVSASASSAASLSSVSASASGSSSKASSASSVSSASSASATA
ncbi:WSC-domain-containing protein [Saitoella complicata NRRL Y-17804]|uniref:WSC-domain-containing protein n=1 Tax=Saitoella complicata (strain BCRC 22490 / CBS 7301 / JCM 7358 / NBRC 10748 / NRRL Y-17804) TaxID=698492 RepID=UPI0008674A99|nr:WSC-domain-containing protein [Saitoella complicata NRRL Y-17804]ODQ56240.1 WSC-domain-containing protein [Saitoella complicata NRRL Y-17804]